jgi:hypothetical protein
MAKGPLPAAILSGCERDGFVVARNLFDKSETDLLRRAAKEDRAFDQHSFGRGDREGGTVRLSLWNHPGDTIQSARGLAKEEHIEAVPVSS